MSNFIKSDDDLMHLKEFADHLRNSDCDYSFLKDFLETFIRKDEEGNALTDYSLESNLPCSYRITNNLLTLELNDLLQKAYRDASITLDLYNFQENSLKDAESYAILQILFHELEHSFQGLVARGIKETRSTMLNSCYKQEYDLFSKYYQNPGFYDCFRLALFMTYAFNKKASIFERNANIESYNALLKLANLEGNDEMIRFLKDARLVRALYGYSFSRRGSLVTTSRFMLSSLFLDGKEEKYTLPFEDKVRYGLPLTRDEHGTLIEIPNEAAENEYIRARRLAQNIKNR